MYRYQQEDGREEVHRDEEVVQPLAEGLQGEEQEDVEEDERD